MVMGTLGTVSFCSLILAMYPSVIPLLNLSTDQASNIGSAIGGITSPIVGMFSAYLIYDALSAQLEANKDQRIKADSDIIFLLINQMDKDYDAYHNKVKKGEEDIHSYGYDALASVSHMFKSNKDNPNIYEAFKRALTTNRLIYLIRTFMMIHERVLISKFNSDLEGMFLQRLKMYYRSRFKFPIKHLIDAFGDQDDELMEEIKRFHNTNIEQ